MRSIYALVLVCFIVTGISAQVNINEPWVWVASENHIPSRPSIVTKGVASATNTPGGRKEAMVWHNGNITWLFGGYGYGGNTVGYLNDLWKYDATTNQWTLVHGDNAVNQAAVYSTLGLGNASNKPGSRRNASGLVDQLGNLWLFSGHGYDGSSSLGVLSDLWKYDPAANEWTWYAGPNTVNYAGNTGTVGVSSPANWPSGRHGASFWQDGLGKVWIFGGHNNANTALNDLWRFDPNIEEWTWMGNGGPSPRSSNMCWANETTGDLYLFGGITGGTTVSNPAAFGFINVQQGTRYNDMWMYSQATSSWSQLKPGSTTINWGTKGVFDPANNPGRKTGAAVWKDADGNFWLQGGTGPMPISSAVEYFHDLWKYDVASNQWAWMNGSTLNTTDGTHGTQGVGDVNNIQYSFKGASSWTDENGKLWMFGGESNGFIPNVFRNAVWKYDPLTNQTTWVKGDDYWRSIPKGTLGVAAPDNGPGERSKAGSWYDNNGNLWMFGGFITYTIPGSTGTDRAADLWKYNIASGQWTWMHGQPAGISSTYGTTGVPASGNRPGGRIGMMTWTDNSNALWLYSGDGSAGNSDDLWKYDIATNQWTFIKGNKGSNSQAVYGSQGLADPANTPGWRRHATGWKDNSGDLWLFGGRSISNDLWKYNIGSNQWTWMKGSNTGGASSVYGTKGIPAASNTPGARQNSSSWKDNLGNLWLFGGDDGGSNTLNDLWKYNPANNEWTWMHGDNINNVAGVYGTRGTSSSLNKPGARNQASNWTDGFGNLWLMGGLGYDINGNYGELNDLWQYNVSTNEWTWVKGDETIAQNGIYGTKGVPHVNNKPGSRYGAAAWTDGSNNFWLYGGTGYGEMGRYYLSDLWKIESPDMAPLPVHLLEFKGQLVNNAGVLNWKTENEESAASYIVERSTDRRKYTPAGTVTANNSPGKHSYNFTDPNIDALGAPVIYYKLKQVDIDGKATFSNIIALSIDKSSIVLFYPNPVVTKANVTITLERAEQVQVRIISNTGAIVKQLQWNLTGGSTVKDIDLGSLPVGQYYFDLSGERTSKRISFVKQ